ncbi:MAG: rod shape-determining protein MreD [Ardenticatenales bacterium]
MNPYAAALVLFVAVVAQVSVMPSASLGSAVPHLPLLVIVSCGYVRGARTGLLWALAAGLLCDQLSAAPIGTYTLPLAAAAIVVGRGSGRLADSIFMPAALAAAATVVFVLVQMVVLALGGNVVAWSWTAVARLVVPAVLLNLLWLPVVYFPLRWSMRRADGPRLAWER